MNKYSKKVLDLLKTKAKDLGFSREELKSVAAKIAGNLTLEEDSSDEEVTSAIEDAVDDAMDFLSVSQSAAQRAISKMRKKYESREDDDDLEEDEPKMGEDGKLANSNQRVNEKKKSKSNDGEETSKDETPAWAKSLAASISSLTERVSGMERGSLSTSRRSKLEKALKDTGRFGERRLREFDRIKDTFKDDVEFEDYLDEVVDDLEAYNQERANEGLGKLGIPGASANDKKQLETSKDEVAPLSDAEVNDLVKEF